jgi:hypothetical protein
MTVNATRLYHNAIRRFRLVLSYGRWRLLRASLEVCQSCGLPARWRYSPSGPNRSYCDECVPRGCDCNIVYVQRAAGAQLACADTDADTDYQDGQRMEQLDARGRRLPCCEFDFHIYGWPRGRYWRPDDPV